jgi:cytidylate kinase
MTTLDSIIDRQIKRWELEKKRREEEQKSQEKVILPGPVITVSRERGSRGTYLEKMLAEKLNYQLVHREIIDYIVKDSGVRRRLIESLDEKIRSEIELWVEGVFKGKYLGKSDYFFHLMKSVLAIAQHGETVIVGRGANFILGLKKGFHIRVVAPLEKRIENLVEYKHFNATEAKKEIERGDKERKEFIHTFFGKNIDDPIYYDLILNSANFQIEEALGFILKAYDSKFKKME